MASRNSHYTARGRDKRPRRKSKNPENSCFWRFLGALFPYKLYRIFIKICGSKKFNPKFSSKIELFSKIFHFLCFCHISSPISESFIAQLLLHRALSQKTLFFLTFWENIWISLTNFLPMLSSRSQPIELRAGITLPNTGN